MAYRRSRYGNEALENGEFCVRRSRCHVLISFQAPLILSGALFHSNKNGGDGVLVDNLLDLLAFFDHYEVQIQDAGATRRSVDHCPFPVQSGLTV